MVRGLPVLFLLPSEPALDRLTSKRPALVDGGQAGLLKVPAPVRITWVCLPKTGS